ncbi:PadR family transcriptional regulator [Streptomyces sp. NPDC053048]|uniref:PadR family transcriptional regulator n=1 Tax=Streptomyces sp. NPDC053048 TaxID=3365694 RepID=UPI0037D4EE23
MLELTILGFLAEGPLHGYQLRRRIAQLSGHSRPVSDGSLYPAIDRLVKSGLVDRRSEPGASAARRHLLTLTGDGRAELLWRRLEFLERPASFFYEGERPLRAADVADPYRRGMLVVARAASRAERAWLRETLT